MTSIKSSYIASKQRPKLIYENRGSYYAPVLITVEMVKAEDKPPKSKPAPRPEKGQRCCECGAVLYIYERPRGKCLKHRKPVVNVSPSEVSDMSFMTVSY